MITILHINFGHFEDTSCLMESILVTLTNILVVVCRSRIHGHPRNFICPDVFTEISGIDSGPARPDTIGSRQIYPRLSHRIQYKRFFHCSKDIAIVLEYGR
jgi:hypothetical protein